MRRVWLGVLAVLSTACSQEGNDLRVSNEEEASTRLAVPTKPDPHSYSRPAEVAVEHLHLELTVDFERRRLTGRARLNLRRAPGATELRLDTYDLEISSVRLDDGTPVEFVLGEFDEILGAALHIPLAEDTDSVTVDYETGDDARALQWLTPEQTSSGRHPFLFTQSQAILARSWIPLQDTPSVRMTWTAIVEVPTKLRAVMSAEDHTHRPSPDRYWFSMPQAVPSYLMALAVGELEFRSLGARTGVYAEPSVVERAAWEFEDTEAMMEAAERLYGPYRWDRYDILVLPPSFPFGGMENPLLTFATPTILAGDRSLVALVAHELAHSWSGNLVTNATWDQFWLNEGFTVYLEHRIMEEVFGRDYSEMLALLALQELEEEVESLGADSADTRLQLDLEGRDPDDAMSAIAYNKGYFLLRVLEEGVGREAWDAFLEGYFDDYAFGTMTTETFLERLDADLLADLDPEMTASLRVREWIYEPGVPSNRPHVESDAFSAVEAELARFLDGTGATDLATTGWETQRWLHFLKNLPVELDAARLADLDSTFAFSQTGNSEVLSAWLLVAVRNDYEPAYPALDDFLTRQGRRKFLVPLYEELMKSDSGRRRAADLYDRARATYHPVSVGTLDPIVRGDGTAGP